MPRISKFNFDVCHAEAIKYSSRSKFASGSSPQYQWLLRNSLLDKACSHMQISPVYSYKRWSMDDVFMASAQCRNRAELKREFAGAYFFAKDNGFLEQACSHMREGHNFWHNFELMAVAIKYTDKSKFIKSEPSAYNFCNKHGLTNLICAHMTQRKDWSRKADVCAEAARHQSRGAFQAMASGAFKQAYAGGYLDEACAHMPAPDYGFSKEKPSILYQIRIVTADGLELFKVGITNRSPNARIAGMGIPAGASAVIEQSITFDLGRDARIAEKRLHRKFSSFRYVGEPLMKNGNTELFTVRLLDPD